MSPVITVIEMLIESSPKLIGEKRVTFRDLELYQFLKAALLDEVTAEISFRQWVRQQVNT